MRFNVSLAAVILLFATALHCQTPSSESTTPSHDLSAERELFEHYSHDFQEIVKALPAGDRDSFQAALDFRDTSMEASWDVGAAQDMLAMYDRITCSVDRIRVKPILIVRLQLYAARMDERVDHVSSLASVVKNVEVVQMALKMKDYYRSANQMLESIATSIK